MQGLYIEERGEEISEEFNDACIFCYGIFVRNPRLESTRFCVPPPVFFSERVCARISLRGRAAPDAKLFCI